MCGEEGSIAGVCRRPLGTRHPSGRHRPPRLRCARRLLQAGDRSGAVIDVAPAERAPRPARRTHRPAGRTRRPGFRTPFIGSRALRAGPPLANGKPQNGSLVSALRVFADRARGSRSQRAGRGRSLRGDCARSADRARHRARASAPGALHRRRRRVSARAGRGARAGGAVCFGRAGGAGAVLPGAAGYHGGGGAGARRGHGSGSPSRGSPITSTWSACVAAASGWSSRSTARTDPVRWLRPVWRACGQSSSGPAASKVARIGAWSDRSRAQSAKSPAQASATMSMRSQSFRHSRVRAGCRSR